MFDKGYIDRGPLGKGLYIFVDNRKIRSFSKLSQKFMFGCLKPVFNIITILTQSKGNLNCSWLSHEKSLYKPRNPQKVNGSQLNTI